MTEFSSKSPRWCPRSAANSASPSIERETARRSPWSAPTCRPGPFVRWPRRSISAGGPIRCWRGFIARLTVLEMIGVAIFKYFGLARGCWLPLTGGWWCCNPTTARPGCAAGQRLLGTLAGALAASVLLWLPAARRAIAIATSLTMFGFSLLVEAQLCDRRVFHHAVRRAYRRNNDENHRGFHVRPPPGHGGWRPAGAAERPSCSGRSGSASLFPPSWREPCAPIATICSNSAAGWPRAIPTPAPSCRRSARAEAANNHVFASLQRLSADPKNQRESLQSAAILANGNQRLTRALTAVAMHLSLPAPPCPRPEFAPNSLQLATETLEALAAKRRSRPAPTIPPQLSCALRLPNFPCRRTPPTRIPPRPAMASPTAPPSNSPAFGTELSAMLLNLSPSRAETTAGVNAALAV